MPASANAAVAPIVAHASVYDAAIQTGIETGIELFTGNDYWTTVSGRITR